MNQLKKMRVAFSIIFFGILSTAVSCYKLFTVKNSGGLWNVYPKYLIAWNAILVLIAFVVLWALYYGIAQDVKNHRNSEITVILWGVLPLAILLIINATIVFGWVSGVPFQ